MEGPKGPREPNKILLAVNYIGEFIWTLNSWRSTIQFKAGGGRELCFGEVAFVPNHKMPPRAPNEAQMVMISYGPRPWSWFMTKRNPQHFLKKHWWHDIMYIIQSPLICWDNLFKWSSCKIQTITRHYPFHGMLHFMYVMILSLTWSTSFFMT